MAVEHAVGAKFYVPLESGEEAVLEYSERLDGSLDLHHTEVPTSQRGKGLGESSHRLLSVMQKRKV
ncbi:hypothetical protein GBAR_LOCUS24718 [Geodia barretti]|uniref:Protein NATD1 n=1 Tax=Geodia barretti TaxID=519541 RepID=A0AA35TB27_GEOBA|nr:hypothetical protein GBAR_LOCUS24718 [Geodia barretti]